MNKVAPLDVARQALEKITQLDCSYEKHWRGEAVDLANEALRQGE